LQVWNNLVACYSKLEWYREALVSLYHVRSSEAAAVGNQSNQLQQRDWLLNTQAALARLGPQRLDRSHKLSGDEFRDQYYAAHRPVIITGMIDDWPALGLWGLDYFKN